MAAALPRPPRQPRPPPGPGEVRGRPGQAADEVGVAVGVGFGEGTPAGDEAVELPFLDLGGAAGGLEVEEDGVGVVDDAAAAGAGLQAVVDVVEVDREVAG